MTNTDGGDFDASFSVHILGMLSVKSLARFDICAACFRREDHRRAELRSFASSLSQESAPLKEAHKIKWRFQRQSFHEFDDTTFPGGDEERNLIVERGQIMRLPSRVGGYKFK